MEKLKDLWSKVVLILTSVRFWQMVCGAVVGYLTSMGYISDEMGTMLMTILFGSVAIGTVDKFSKK